MGFQKVHRFIIRIIIYLVYQCTLSKKTSFTITKQIEGKDFTTFLLILNARYDKVVETLKVLQQPTVPSNRPESTVVKGNNSLALIIKGA